MTKLPAEHILAIDLETMDVKPTSVVIAIGACMLNLRTMKYVHSFEELIDPNCKLQASGLRSIGAGTMNWWRDYRTNADELFKPTKATADAMFSGTEQLDRAILAFSKWMNEVVFEIDPNTLIVCRGPEFDYVILDNIYTQLNIRNPIRRFSLLDSDRTTERMRNIMGVPASTQKNIGHILPYEGDFHTPRFDSAKEALDSAKAYQATWWLYNHGKDKLNSVIDGWSKDEYAEIIINE